LLLADHHNVEKETPGFASKLTANKVKYAVDGAGLNTWNKLEETQKLGLYNKDAATTTYDEVKERMGTGKCGFYPMVTWFTKDVSDNSKVGLIAVPGAKAGDYGLTTWMPNANYIPAKSKNIAAAKKFVAFLTTKKATDAAVKAVGYSGPFVTKDQSPAPTSVPLATKQLAALLKGKSTPAAEYISPVKGPNLANITAQVLTGQITAEEGAALYDRDNVAAAKQLGLKGW
jgi:raffinose/stachyose/melibiose transport system substrate-binding protein